MLLYVSLHFFFSCKKIFNENEHEFVELFFHFLYKLLFLFETERESQSDILNYYYMSYYGVYIKSNINN